MRGDRWATGGSNPRAPDRSYGVVDISVHGRPGAADRRRRDRSTARDSDSELNADGNCVADAAGDHKEMPERVCVRYAFHVIEDGARGVHDATGQQPGEREW